eukprot:15482440-Alexandrium_andersonii.AAC.1
MPVALHSRLRSRRVDATCAWMHAVARRGRPATAALRGRARPHRICDPVPLSPNVFASLADGIFFRSP